MGNIPTAPLLKQEFVGSMPLYTFPQTWSQTGLRGKNMGKSEDPRDTEALTFSEDSRHDRPGYFLCESFRRSDLPQHEPIGRGPDPANRTCTYCGALLGTVQARKYHERYTHPRDALADGLIIVASLKATIGLSAAPLHLDSFLLPPKLSVDQSYVFRMAGRGNAGLSVLPGECRLRCQEEAIDPAIQKCCFRQYAAFRGMSIGSKHELGSPDASSM